MGEKFFQKDEIEFLPGTALLMDETSARQMFGPRIPAEKFGFVRLMLATATLTAACSQVAQPIATATEEPTATATATWTITPEPSPTPIKEPTATPTLTPEEQLWADLPKHLPDGLFEKEEEREALFKILSEAARNTDIKWQRAEVTETYTGFDESAGTQNRKLLSKSMDIGARLIDVMQVQYQEQQIWCVIAGTPTEPIFLYGGLVKDNPDGKYWMKKEIRDLVGNTISFQDFGRGKYYKFFVFTEVTDAQRELLIRRLSQGYTYNFLTNENIEFMYDLVVGQSEDLSLSRENKVLSKPLLFPLVSIRLE